MMLTGLNAPMMVKAIQYSALRNDLNSLTEEVKEAALHGIMALTYEPEEATRT